MSCRYVCGSSGGLLKVCLGSSQHEQEQEREHEYEQYISSSRVGRFLYPRYLIPYWMTTTNATRL